MFEYCSTVHMYHTFIRSYVDGRLGCFLAIVNSAAVNTAVPVSFWINVLSRCGISGSHGNPTLSFLRARHTVLYRGCPGSPSHSQCRSIPFSAHLLQHLLFTDLLIFNWRIIALQCCVGSCHTSAWISPDGYTYVPFPSLSPPTPSHLPACRWFRLFDDSHSDRGEVGYLMILWFAFLW